MAGARNNILFVLLFVSLVLLVFSLFFAFRAEKPLEVVEHEVFFEVAENVSVGFDVNASAFFFGRTSPAGAGIRRFVFVANRYDFPIRVVVLLSEDINEVFEFDREHVIVQGGNATISLRLFVPEGFSEGNYSGLAEFEIYRG